MPALGLSLQHKDIHALYIPEVAVDLAAEAARLKTVRQSHLRRHVIGQSCGRRCNLAAATSPPLRPRRRCYLAAVATSPPLRGRRCEGGGQGAVSRCAGGEVAQWWPLAARDHLCAIESKTDGFGPTVWLDTTTQVMDELDCVNIFLSEGAGVKDIVAEMESRGEEVPRDAFGHVKLDKIQPGVWFAKQFAEKIGAEKVMVQKSGYFARAAAPNAEDRTLIKACADLGVDSALAGVSGCVGHDEDQGDTLRAIEFPRIKGGKHFNVETPWFTEMLAQIGQGV